LSFEKTRRKMTLDRVPGDPGLICDVGRELSAKNIG